MQAAAPPRRKNSRERPHASASDTVPIALVDKHSLTIKFFESTTFISALRKLEKEINLEYFIEANKAAGGLVE